MSFVQVISMRVIRLCYLEKFLEHLHLTERFAWAFLHVLRNGFSRPLWPVTTRDTVDKNAALSGKETFTTDPFFDVVFITLEWLSCGSDILVLNWGGRSWERSS
jgi:hypothetical protein